MLDPREVYFTDIRYIPTWKEQLLKLKKVMLQHFQYFPKCSECGKPLDTEEALLFIDKQLCKECESKLLHSSGDTIVNE